MTMKSLIDKLKERNPYTTPRLVKRKDRYVSSVERLMMDIQNWLDEAKKQSVMTVTESKLNITEPDIGTYQVPCLQISTSDRTGPIVKIEPKGAMNVGIVGKESRDSRNLRGRVELSCGPYIIPFGLAPDGSWKAVTVRGGLRDLDEQTFSDILGEVLLDG
jgi:hypothetical protein